MENASDAILMAGAMLIFAIALTVAMTVFSQARATIDTVVYESDITNYYEYFDTAENTVKNRIVGWETVIPTLYKYYKENYTVVFLEEGNTPKGLPLYTTQTNPALWSGTEIYADNRIKNIAPIVNKYPGMNTGNSTNNIQICSFDVDEETKRHEPWTGSTMDYKANLDAFLNGGTFIYPSDSRQRYDYSSNGGFIKRIGANTKFRETIGEYAYKESSGSQISQELNQGIRNNKNKRVIVYQLVGE